MKSYVPNADLQLAPDFPVLASQVQSTDPSHNAWPSALLFKNIPLLLTTKSSDCSLQQTKQKPPKPDE